ncbi:hypothetical protein QWZ10_15180 [Paracoccus cavernae]|uniref:Response regulatory domain-containing protein n=1 Tax=Paracoccus cavernae TaxID=1571207 RepID=A0ABT8DBF6_9RHOB|nr:hypothetical protein [Paracoccus cavernae]
MIIADYNLDNGDNGLTAINALREEVNLEIPAIMITAQRSSEIARACNEINVPLMEKPIRREELQLLLQRILS